MSSGGWIDAVLGSGAKGRARGRREGTEREAGPGKRGTGGLTVASGKEMGSAWEAGIKGINTLPVAVRLNKGMPS